VAGWPDRTNTDHCDADRESTTDNALQRGDSGEAFGHHALRDHPGTIRVFAHLGQADLAALVELAEAGKLSVRVARSFTLDQAAGAQRLLAEGHSGGKIVLEVA
jgi:NADPH:quinone reductase-like Zn-dependent oxidoreductase